MQRFVAALALAGALALTASPAFGQSIPPGNSGADQYAEGVPGADGNKKPGGGSGGGAGGDGDSSSGSSGLPASVVSELEDGGATGSAAAVALGASAPARDSGAGKGSGSAFGQDGAGETAVAQSEPASPLAEIVDTITTGSEDGMGTALPILLLIVLAGGVGVALWMRTGRSQPPSDT